MTDQFREEDHTYWRDSIWVPSCTQVLDWAGLAKVGPEGPREHARIRGTAVHELIEAYEHGDKMAPESCTASVEIFDEVIARFEAWKLFRKEVPISKLVLEHWRIGEANGFAYGVTPDIVCEMEGVPCVIETKNTYAPEVTHPIQTAAQVIACGPTRFWELGSWRRFALYLKGDGTYKLKQHVSLEDFDHWRTLLAAHETIRKLKKEKVWSPIIGLS